MTNEELFNNNTKLAYKVANKYTNNYLLEYDDIKQIALLGLWQAALKYNEKYAAFSTFAYKVIENTINSYLRKNKKSEKEISINTVICDGLTIEDMLLGEDDIQIWLEEIEVLEVKQKLCEIEMTEIERKIYGMLQKGYKQQFVARKFNMSQSQISRIERKIINKTYQKVKEK